MRRFKYTGTVAFLFGFSFLSGWVESPIYRYVEFNQPMELAWVYAQVDGNEIDPPHMYMTTTVEPYSNWGIGFSAYGKRSYENLKASYWRGVVEVDPKGGENNPYNGCWDNGTCPEIQVKAVSGHALPGAYVHKGTTKSWSIDLSHLGGQLYFLAHRLHGTQPEL